MREKTIEQQADRFFNIMLTIDQHYEEYAKSVGMSLMTVVVLDIIYNTPENCTQKYICEQSHYTKQCVNIIIKSFLQQEYVELKELPLDRRNKSIQLSEKGRKFADKIIGDLMKIEQNTIGKLSFEQREKLIELADIYEKTFRSGIEANKKGEGLK